jgi:molecular chaperone GrpE (heat shock protein)
MDRLLILQQRIKHRIEQAKNQIHESHNRAFIDIVLIEIDTLNWVLNEISQHSINSQHSITRKQLKKALAKQYRKLKFR